MPVVRRARLVFANERRLALHVVSCAARRSAPQAGVAAVTQIGSFPLPANNFGGTRLHCPSGLIATGGGMLPAQTSTALETADAPAFGTAQFDRLLTQPDGEIGAPVAWQGNILNESVAVSTARLGVICVP